MELPEGSVETIKGMARAMSKLSGRRVTQTMLINDAVEAFIKDSGGTKGPEPLAVLTPCEGHTRRIVTPVPPEYADTVKRMAREMSAASGRMVSQAKLMGYAVQSFIGDCMTDPEIWPRLFPSEGPQNSDAAPTEETAPAGPAMSF